MTNLHDVIKFLNDTDEASRRAVVNELAEMGVDYECSSCNGDDGCDCDEHECDCNEDIQLAIRDVIVDLVNRANLYGLDDMLENLKQIAWNYGANLKIDLNKKPHKD